jgi:putative DNA primase/helicase
VFACTTEVENWSKETEARRFWPVQVGQIDADELRVNKDQLWGEAVAAYKSGAPWHLDNPELIVASRQEQESRYESHPWTKKIAEFVVQLESTTSEDILSMAINKPLERQNKADQVIVGGCLRALGWTRGRMRDKNEGGRQVRRWYPPELED